MTRTRPQALTAAAVVAVLAGAPLVGGVGSTSALWRDALTFPFPAVTAGDEGELPGEVVVLEGWALSETHPGGKPTSWPSNANAYSTVNFRLLGPVAVDGYLAFELDVPGHTWVWLDDKVVDLKTVRIPVTKDLLESGIDLLLLKNSKKEQTVSLTVTLLDRNDVPLASSTFQIPWSVRLAQSAPVADPGSAALEPDLAGVAGAGPEPDDDREAVPGSSESPADGSDTALPVEPGDTAPEAESGDPQTELESEVQPEAESDSDQSTDESAADPGQAEREQAEREAAKRAAAQEAAEQAAGLAAEAEADLKAAEAEAARRAEEAADAHTAADEAARRLAEAEAAGAEADLEAARNAADEAARAAADAEVALRAAEAEVARRAVEAEAAREAAERAAREVG